MVNTKIARPVHCLQPFIRSYELREFNTHGNELIKPLIADTEPYLAFFIKGKVDYFMTKTNSKDFAKYTYFPDIENFAGLMGVQTSMRGSLVFRGDIKIFTIHFKPAGFTAIFGFPASLIINEFSAVSEILNNQVKELHERIYYAKEIQEMKTLSEEFLLKKLLSRKLKYGHEQLIQAICHFNEYPKRYNTKMIAHHSNMSLKTFERKFISQIGITPKLFERINRFSKALNMKLENPSTSWTNITHECGYFDQMHFIKNFKIFAGESPTEFMKTTPLPEEEFTDISSYK